MSTRRTWVVLLALTCLASSRSTASADEPRAEPNPARQVQLDVSLFEVSAARAKEFQEKAGVEQAKPVVFAVLSERTAYPWQRLLRSDPGTKVFCENCVVTRSGRDACLTSGQERKYTVGYRLLRDGDALRFEPQELPPAFVGTKCTLRPTVTDADRSVYLHVGFEHSWLAKIGATGPIKLTTKALAPNGNGVEQIGYLQFDKQSRLKAQSASTTRLVVDGQTLVTAVQAGNDENQEMRMLFLFVTPHVLVNAEAR